MQQFIADKAKVFKTEYKEGEKYRAHANKDKTTIIKESALIIWYEECISMSHSCHDDGTTDIFDTQATSGVATEKSKKVLIPTGEKYKKVFSMPMVDTSASKYKMKMDHNMRYPATETNVVPELQATLVSGSKMVDAGYVTILDKTISKSMTVTPPKYQLIENQYSKDTYAIKLDSGAFPSQTKSAMRI